MLRTNYIGEHFGSESSVVFFPLVKFYRYCTASLLGSQHLFFTFEKLFLGVQRVLCMRFIYVYWRSEGYLPPMSARQQA